MAWGDTRKFRYGPAASTPISRGWAWAAAASFSASSKAMAGGALRITLARAKQGKA
ncbi:MAG: hypothetical protein O7A69_10180 [SAR324 cluster bacterium]|nr:hypothetical protein [SAR324 cluster bacterium]